METKHVLCATCDISCQLVATRKPGEKDFTLSGDYGFYPVSTDGLKTASSFRS